MMKQIEVLSAMMKEERPEVEKHIINEELIALYRAKIKSELYERVKED